MHKNLHTQCIIYHEPRLVELILWIPEKEKDTSEQPILCLWKLKGKPLNLLTVWLDGF